MFVTKSLLDNREQYSDHRERGRFQWCKSGVLALGNLIGVDRSTNGESFELSSSDYQTVTFQHELSNSDFGSKSLVVGFS